MAQKFPHLHVQKKKKNSWSLEAALHSGLWKRWREQHGEGGRVIIISVFTRGTCSCKVQRRRSVIWPSRCSISRASTVPFPSSCLKENINNVPTPPRAIADVTHTGQRQTAATPGQRSSILCITPLCRCVSGGELEMNLCRYAVCHWDKRPAAPSENQSFFESKGSKKRWKVELYSSWNASFSACVMDPVSSNHQPWQRYYHDLFLKMSVPLTVLRVTLCLNAGVITLQTAGLKLTPSPKLSSKN